MCPRSSKINSALSKQVKVLIDSAHPALWRQSGYIDRPIIFTVHLFWTCTLYKEACKMEQFDIPLCQGHTNPGYQITWMTKCCMVVTKVCRPSVWNLIYVTLLAPRILSWLLYFWKICTCLHWGVIFVSECPVCTCVCVCLHYAWWHCFPSALCCDFTFVFMLPVILCSSSHVTWLMWHASSASEHTVLHGCVTDNSGYTRNMATHYPVQQAEGTPLSQKCTTFDCWQLLRSVQDMPAWGLVIVTCAHTWSMVIS
jgi:hypothetical protein